MNADGTKPMQLTHNDSTTRGRPVAGRQDAGLLERRRTTTWTST